MRSEQKQFHGDFFVPSVPGLPGTKKWTASEGERQIGIGTGDLEGTARFAIVTTYTPAFGESASAHLPAVAEVVASAWWQRNHPEIEESSYERRADLLRAMLANLPSIQSSVWTPHSIQVEGDSVEFRTLTSGRVVFGVAVRGDLVIGFEADSTSATSMEIIRQTTAPVLDPS